MVMYKVWTYIEDNDIKCELEQVPSGDDLHLFVHITVKNFSKDVLKKCREEFKKLKEWAFDNYETGICAYTQNEKWVKAVDSNYNVLAEVGDYNGKVFKVIQWL